MVDGQNPTTSDGSDSGEQELAELAGLRMQWAEAERRLYPLATTATELYQGAVEAVRAVADGLADVVDHAELVRRWADRDAEVKRAGQQSGIILSDQIPVDHVAGAAFAHRDREVSAAQEAADRRSRVQAARSAGNPWAVLHERGEVAHGLRNPYQAIELHLANGLALVSTVEQDPSTAGTNYVTSVVEMDADGVQILAIDVPGLDDRETGDADSFARNRSELRQLIESRPS